MDSRKEEIQALSDVSFHRVWWRRRWVLWFDAPFTFEKRRPWSHHPLPRQALVLLLTAAATLWALAILLGALALMIAAIASTAAAAALGAAITRSEVQFWAWWTKNDNRAALDAFRRPERIHAAVTSSESALKALADAGNPAEIAEEFALEHARSLSGFRTYGTVGWVRLADIADTDPLLELHAAMSQWRALNETWTDEAEWEAAFKGSPPELPPRFRPRRFLERLRGDGEDPVAETAARLRKAAHAARRTLEHAARHGLTQTRSLSTSTTGAGARIRSVIPTIVIAPILGAVSVFGITLANSPAPSPTSGWIGEFETPSPQVAPQQGPQEIPTDAATDESETPTYDVAPKPPVSEKIQMLTDAIFTLLVPIAALTLIIFGSMIAMRSGRGGW